MSHQVIKCTPRTGPSRRITSSWSGGVGFLVVLAREAEVVLPAAQVAEPRQVVDEQEELGAVGLGLLAALDLGGDLGEDLRARSRQPPTSRLVRQGRGRPGENAGIGVIFGRAVEHEETRALANRVGTGRCETGRPG